MNLVCNNAGVAGSMSRRRAWTSTTGAGSSASTCGASSTGTARSSPTSSSTATATSSTRRRWPATSPGHSAYSASKWAVVAITEGLYQQLRTQGSTVGVSCLCPGWVATDIATSDRNRPEWAAPRALEEQPVDERDAMVREFVLDQLKQRDGTGPGRRPRARRGRRTTASGSSPTWRWSKGWSRATERSSRPRTHRLRPSVPAENGSKG